MTTTPSSKQALLARPGEPGIDPRGPRFGAAIAAILLLVAVAVGLLSGLDLPASVGGRIARPDFVIVAVVAALFAWGAFAGVRRHPYGLFFARVIRPRLTPPAHLENPRPPTFAQLVGFVITVVGLCCRWPACPAVSRCSPPWRSSRHSSTRCSTTAPVARSTSCSCAGLTSRA